MKCDIKQEHGGEGMMGWIKPVCSCGWEGTQHFAYNDTQYTDARQQADNHVREAYRATHQLAPQTSGKEGEATVRPCACTPEQRRNCDYCAGYGKTALVRKEGHKS